MYAAYVEGFINLKPDVPDVYVLKKEATRTFSKGHGKIANNNSFRLSRNNIRLQCLELSNDMLQELIMANKGMA